MYVFCVGMYRACSTWQYEVASDLLHTHRNGERLGYLTGAEYRARGVQEPGSRVITWRTLKSHEGDPAFATDLEAGRAIGLYSYRDLRDVAYSLMHKRGLSFDELVRKGMLHQLLVNHKFWTDKPGILVQRYEDLVSDPTSAVEAIAKHLGIAISRAEAWRVSERFSFEANKRRTQRLARRLLGEGIDLHDPANAQVWDEQTLLHWNHIREGRPNDWRHRATPEQRVVFDQLFRSWLESYQYEPDLRTRSFLQARALKPTHWLGQIRGRVALARGWINCLLGEISRTKPLLSRLSRVARPSRTITGPAPGMHLRIDQPEGARGPHHAGEPERTMLSKAG